MRLAFVTHSLRPGGSERQLVTLATGLAAAGHEVVVVTFRGAGTFERELRDQRIETQVLDRGVRWYHPLGLRELVGLLRSWRPDIIHSYLDLPNLVVATLRPLLRDAKIVWGVRAADVEAASDLFHRATLNATVALARIPQLIIVNSHAGFAYHAQRGYPESTMTVIQNGIDTARYRPDPAGRQRVRAELGIRADDRLVGLVARIDAVKDHPNFLEAAALVAGDRPDVRFVCVGAAEGSRHDPLALLAFKRGIADSVQWLHEREDMASVYSALDVNCLSSISEGFPNVAAEGMACGTPCVVTDVGDAAEIVGDTGVVVPPACPPELADGISRMLDRVERDGDAVAEATRARIVERHGSQQLIERTEAALASLLEGGDRAQATRITSASA